MDALPEREAFIRDIIDAAPDAIFVYDLQGRIVRANPAAARQTGYSLATLGTLSVGDVSEVSSTEEVIERSREMLDRGERQRRYASYHRRATGEVIPVELGITLLNCGSEPLFAAVVRDASERRALQARLEQRLVFNELLLGISSELVGVRPEHVDAVLSQSLELIGRFFDADRAMICDVDLDQRCLLVTHHWMVDAEGVPMPSRATVPFSSYPWCMSSLLRQQVVHVRDVETLPDTARIDRDNFRKKGLRSTVYVPMVRHGELNGVLCLQSFRETRRLPNEVIDDLRLLAQLLIGASEAVQLGEQLQHRAFHDPLTNLGNRQLLHDRIEQATQRCQRSGQLLAVLLMDLDDFKLINDSLGHDTGDQLLRRMAQRLAGTVGSRGTLARLGGDEFVILAEMDAIESIAALAQEVLACVSQPLQLSGHDLVIHPTVGIAVYPQDGLDRETLLRHADAALYQAKREGKNRASFYNPAMSVEADQVLALRYQLGQAVRDDQLSLHYQPIIDLITGRVQQLEALVRWRHPEQGLLSPGSFLNVAERSELICQVDRWVAHQALSRAGALHGLPVSINVSLRDLNDPQQLGRLAEVLAAQPYDPDRSIEIEITESMLMSNSDEVVSNLRLLKQRVPGLRIAIDDFGSGYSSLSILRQLPIDTLKVAPAFVRDLAIAGSSAEAIVRSVFQLARNLNVRIVAEGVERLDQYWALRRLADEQPGVFLAQGFLIAQPLTESGLEGVARASFDPGRRGLMIP